MTRFPLKKNSKIMKIQFKIQCSLSSA